MMAGRPGRGRKGPSRTRKRTPGAENVRLLVVDCNGALTDGCPFLAPSGEVMQRFSVHDGCGARCAQAAGVEPSEMAFVGDDLLDMPAIRLAGKSAAGTDGRTTRLTAFAAKAKEAPRRREPGVAS
jgi:3-deoxy-D-manno-octulosonate 8-phosphate phosphatase KdsC-like HAD superfamily phosphatase